MATVPREAGKSSFDLIDTEAFFGALPLGSTSTLLDLGCGVGRYALPLAERLGPGGRVRGFDLWPEGVAELVRSAAERGLSNLGAEVADLGRLAPVGDAEADLVLMATVVHDLAERGHAAAALGEVARALRPGGWLAVVEFKKVDRRPGPPLAIRLAPEELAALVEPAGFGPARLVDLGEHAYLALFRRSGVAG
ncbi:MAG: class I SAM-dependent methyltransferase [Deferrisomatales bacterium]